MKAEVSLVGGGAFSSVIVEYMVYAIDLWFSLIYASNSKISFLVSLTFLVFLSSALKWSESKANPFTKAPQNHSGSAVVCLCMRPTPYLHIYHGKTLKKIGDITLATINELSCRWMNEHFCCNFKNGHSREKFDWSIILSWNTLCTSWYSTTFCYFCLPRNS